MDLGAALLAEAVNGKTLYLLVGLVVGGGLLRVLALQMDQSVQVGQWIKMGDMSGRVTEMRWRATSVETRNWETLVIPNSVLVKNQFLVLGQRDGQAAPWRRWVHFNVDFRYAPTDVMAAVEAILNAAAIPSAATEPAPNCILMGLHDSYAGYAVRYWLTDVGKDDATDSVVRTRVYFALKRSRRRRCAAANSSARCRC